MIRVNAVAGSVEMLGLRSESRIDLRNADLKLAVDRPAVIAVYSEGDEPVEVAMPAEGFRIDAAAREAEITSTPADLLKTWGLDVSRVDGESEQKLTGSVHGGGPLLTIRTRQGSITLAAAGVPKPKTAAEARQRP
jgi:hypothetical protein